MKSSKNINKQAKKTRHKEKFPLVFMLSCLTWLSKVTKVTFSELTPLKKVLFKIAKVYDTRGKAECIKYTKQLRSSFVNFLFSNDEVQPYLPKILRPIRSLLHTSISSYALIRLALTVMSVSRFIRLKENPSVESITKRPGFTGNPQVLETAVKSFLKEVLGINPLSFGKISRNLGFSKFHMTSKSGPTGRHALWSAIYDAIHTPSSLHDYLRIVGGEKLYGLRKKASQLYFQIPKFFESRLSQGSDDYRRITAIKDKEGKTREVAILDYWSQAALKPLHSKLYKHLSRIYQDCTHNQTKLLMELKPRNGSKFHSIDLTTATDRFPIAIEEMILRVWFGKDYAAAWKSLMVDFPFRFQDEYIKYETGNPMGAYSSWATFAVAHHFFVWMACKKANRNWRRCPYMLLGDDIVIADDKVAEAYKDLLLEWDIPFNEAKTHTSFYGFEFAKQYIYKEQNISPFPISALYERRKSTFESVAIIVRELTYKNWNSDIWDSVKQYLKIVRKMGSKEFKSIFYKLKLGIGLMFHLQGESDLGITLMEYVTESTAQKCSWTKSTMKLYSQFIAGNVVTDLFEEARDRITGNNPEPLGELSTLMVMAITSLNEDGMDCFDQIEAVPFLQIYGLAEERYLELMKPTIGARLIKDGREMRAVLEKVDIPISDRDFYIRQRDVIVIKALRSSKKIVELLKKHMDRNPGFLRNPILPGY